MTVEEAKSLMKKAQDLLSTADVEKRTHQKLLDELAPKIAAKESECRERFGTSIAKLKAAIPKKEAEFIAGVQSLSKDLGLIGDADEVDDD